MTSTSDGRQGQLRADPSRNNNDFADLPSDVLGKLQIIFHADPVNAAFRAMGLE